MSQKVLLYNEDCLAGLGRRLKLLSVDVVVTSPPYNIGVGYKRYNDRISRKSYLQWLGDWAEALKPVLKNSGSLFLNLGSKPSSPQGPFQVIGVVQEVFKLQNVIHWVKSIYIENASYGENLAINVGHFKPINSRRFLNDNHEYIFHLTKTGQVELDRLALGVPYKDRTNITRWQKGRNKLRCRGNCWFIPYETIQNRDKDRPHPASFPPRLAANCIRLHGLEENMVILDPFMGLGSTGLACRDLGISFVGFEIDAYYYKQAREKLMVERH